MSEFISGKEALIALANGESVEMADSKVGMDWTVISKDGFLDEQKISAPCLHMFFEESENIQFRLRPRTITINGIEVPAPFDGILKHKQYAYVLNTASPDSYSSMKFYEGGNQPLICWTDEEEIKQVVAALRSIFNPQ